MRCLVVYYSRDGSTKKVAQELASCLRSDTEELTDTVDRSGPMGYLKGGRDAGLKRLTEIGPVKYDPSMYDMVLVGTPVWSFNMTPAIRTYLTRHKGRIGKTAFFCTFGGSGGKAAMEQMGGLLGLTPVSTLGLTEAEVKAGTFQGKVKAFSEGLAG